MATDQHQKAAEQDALVALVVGDNVDETASEDTVTAARAEAEAAEAAVEALEAAVVEGDETITPDDIERERGKSRFARLREKAAALKADRARRAARLRALDDLRRDIEAHSGTIGRDLAKSLEKAEKALIEFYRLASERDAAVHEFGKRAILLDLPRHMAPFAPGKEHAHVGLNEHRLFAGERRIDRGGVQVGGYVDAMVRRAAAAAKGHNPSQDDLALYDHVVKVDALEDTGPGDDALFYTNSTGRVFVYDLDHEPNDVAIRAGGLTKISRSEAKRISARSQEVPQR